MSHMPTPWQVKKAPQARLYHVCGRDGSSYSTDTLDLAAECQRKVEAEHIVLCVNSHDALVEVLKRCVSVFEKIREGKAVPEALQIGLIGPLLLAREALERATGIHNVCQKEK